MSEIGPDTTIKVWEGSIAEAPQEEVEAGDSTGDSTDAREVGALTSPIQLSNT